MAAKVRSVYQAIGRNAGKLNPKPALVSSILFQHMLEYTLHFTSGIQPLPHRPTFGGKGSPLYQAIGRNAGKLNTKPALTTALLTMAHADGSPQRSLHISDNDDTFGKLRDTVQYETLREALLRGVRLLHEGMHPKGFQIVGKLFSSGTIQVCTVLRTMYYQVSTFAYLVVIMDVQFYNGKYQFYEEYPIGDVLHTVRLASRPGRDVDVE
ncbi:unnamed protein product [Heligmosomoides polygyrus]|uniref:Uncharacterized protein n=1 Tax=Heligmosomoides polygyrus TaxID=6339 RepID=A0A3P8AI96_HELPZ|nr:unnamed protein product [Heligmosomoides polygyrus]